MLSSAQMSRAHGLETRSLNLTVNEKRLERVSESTPQLEEGD